MLLAERFLPGTGWIEILLLAFYAAWITEKILDNYPEISRKILHIMVGNIAFLLPIFVTREIMAFVAAAPFILLTFLMSPHTPIKSIRGKTSAAGHGIGLVYYSITWTILAYVFFNNMVVIAIGILAMSYGDGFASIIGVKFGQKKYNVFSDEKSYIGSFAMFVFTFITMIIALLYYEISITFYVLLAIAFISLIASIVEGLTPKGFDNLAVPFIAVFLYWLIFLSDVLCV